MQHSDKKIKYISKKMSYALRHNPDKYGIKLDEYGYTDLDHFINALNRVHHLALTRDDIATVIAQSNKKRFEIKGDRICALYGHSIPGIIHHQEATCKYSIIAAEMQYSIFKREILVALGDGMLYNH